MAHEVNYWHDRARFDANMDLHHHLICLGCRRIEDITDDALDQVTVSSRRQSAFQVLRHRVEFHRYCQDCQRKPGCVKQKKQS
ncbi:MAG: transcriptional repressor [Nitrospirales bacterium]|nr:transcriptional repressor [Nitrospirales bacterium]